MTFGRRLKTLRQEKGLTQAQFGACFNLAESTISLYETGKRTPHYDLLKRFALFFNITIDYLLGHTDERYPASFFGEGGETYVHTSQDKPVQLPVVQNITWAKHHIDYEYKAGYQEWVSSSAVRDGRYYWLQVGDSRLSGDGILPGDLLLIREQSFLDSGNIGVIMFENEHYFVLKVFKEADVLILQASDPAFPPVVLTGKECAKVKILGQAVQLRRHIILNH
ncbi:MAG: helix-turn-helix domain-containing protein [Clostridia bacterium]|jgi:repressor LexA|nr:helix-turn-helix domain-containing protein [Clostridia bacterium]